MVAERGRAWLETVAMVTAMVAHLLDQGLALINGQDVAGLDQRRGDGL
jgi:hypothetical protein